MNREVEAAVQTIPAGFTGEIRELDNAGSSTSIVPCPSTLFASRFQAGNGMDTGKDDAALGQGLLQFLQVVQREMASGEFVLANLQGLQ